MVLQSLFETVDTLGTAVRNAKEAKAGVGE
jgi:hypothetical protein